MATAYADLSPLAKLVLYLESLPDPDDAPVTPTASVAQRSQTPLPLSAVEPEGGCAAVKRTELRDRMGRIITLDRADTSRSIVNQ